MNKTTCTFSIASLPFLLLPLAQPSGGNEIELDEAACFMEWNSTDGDFGIQFFWDGEPWSEMIVSTRDEEVLKVRACGGNLRRQGLTEGFFESAEPSADELSMDEFLDRFLEGEYEFEGTTQDGRELEGETLFSHSIPTPIDGLMPADGDLVDAALPLTLTFDPVTTDIHGQPLAPELYEVVLETEDDDEFERVFSIVLRGETTTPTVTVPAQFLQPGGEYKFEVIVQEPSGNRTITEAVFETL